MTGHDRRPAVSVVLPVHNGLPFVSAAIESILAQTLRDFELVVIDDRSTDGTRRYLDSVTDPRMAVHANRGRGIVDALNHGIEVASAPYVARMDADDWSHPDRLARQVARLDRHPELVLVGSSFEVVDDRGDVVRLEPALPHDVDLRRELYVRNPFGHATVTMRRQAVVAVGGYRSDAPRAEDLDLWLRLAEVGGLSAIGDPLVRWRRHDDSTSSRHRAEQQAATRALLDERWAREPAARTPTSELRRRLDQIVRDPELPSGGRAQVDRALQVELAIGVGAFRRRRWRLAVGQARDVLGLGVDGGCAAMLYAVTGGRFTTLTRVSTALSGRRRARRRREVR